MPRHTPTIGVDLDGTLAEYRRGMTMMQIGRPIPSMVQRVREVLRSGCRVKIFTARVAGLYSDNVNARLQAEGIKRVVEKWVEETFGFPLEVTAVKDMSMVELWDDIGREVVHNKGVFRNDQN